MQLRYSIYEAKAKLSAILRAVRQGRRITITDRGREVARIVPIEDEAAVDQRLADLEAAGILASAEGPAAVPIGEPRPGSLQRFLEDRDA